jgi:glycosyltransferase involved in cell wall biosynthesis
MRILFAVQQPHIPYRVGGGPMDIHHLALTLTSLGHEAALVATLPGLPEIRFRQFGYRFRQLTSKEQLLVYRDVRSGYETFRVGHWLVAELLRERIASWQPDAVIVQGPLAWQQAMVAIELHVPVVMRQIDTYGPERLLEAASTSEVVRSLLSDPLFTIVSNSRFVSARVEELLGVRSPVVYPLMRPEESRAEERRANYVTFVGPVPMKGLAIALRVAALLPERNFLFVDSYPCRGAQRKARDRELSSLANVKLRATSVGLRDVYASTAILLVPSQVEEAFGRVIVEAGFSGIPAVASRIGGIPESIGKSGVLLEASDSPEQWADALTTVLSDADTYRRMEAAAIVNANREDFGADVVAERFLEVVDAHVGRIRGGV